MSIPRTTTGPQPHLAPYRGRQHAFAPCPRFGPWVSPKVLSAGSSPSGHLRRFPVRSHGLHASTFLPPFAPRPLRRFTATMGALTPQRLTRPLGSPRLPRAAFPPFRLQPPDERSPSLSRATLHRGEYPGSSVRFPASPFPSRLAHSPSRIEFVILRTGGSPPVAPHPASLRRSYDRFRGRRAYAPEGTFTPLTSRLPGRTRSALLSAIFFPDARPPYVALFKTTSRSCKARLCLGEKDRPQERPPTSLPPPPSSRHPNWAKPPTCK